MLAIVRASLHAFFKRKSPSSASPRKCPSTTKVVDAKYHRQSPSFGPSEEGVVVDLTGSPPAAKKARVDSGEDGSSVPSISERKTSLNQPTSAYFSKGGRSVSRAPLEEKVPNDGDGIEIDETDDIRPRPSRRVTMITQPSLATTSTPLKRYRLFRAAAPRPSQSGSAFDSYAISRAGPSTESLVASSQGRTEEQERRHQEWQRRLLAPGGIIPRRRSLALDEAAAAEARRHAGEDGEGDDLEIPVMDADAEDEVEGKKDAEGVGSKLKEKYAAKGTDATKGKVIGKSKKIAEEVGPSGQTYTPLEKQFMEIKAENPDVLLMMEGWCLSVGLKQL